MLVDGEVNLPRSKALGQLKVVTANDDERDLRVELCESPGCLDNLVAHATHKADAQRELGIAAKARGLPYELVDLRQQRPCASHQVLPRYGWHHRTTPSIEQRHAKLALERQDGLRHRRLRNVAGVGRLGEAALVVNGDGISELAELHGHSP